MSAPWKSRISFELTTYFNPIYSVQIKLDKFYFFFYCKFSNPNLSLSQVLKQTQEELTTSTDSLVLFDCNYIQSISNSVANLILEDHKDNTFLKTEPKDIECL